MKRPAPPANPHSDPTMKTNVSTALRHASFAFLAALLATSCERSEPSKKQHASHTRVRGHHDSPQVTRKERNAKGGYQWLAGDFSNYQLESAHVIGNPSKSETLDADKGGLVFRGTYSVGVLAVDGDKVLLAAAMSGSKVRRNGQSCPQLEQLLDETPALITVSGNGAIQSIAFPAEVPADDRRILRSIYGLEFQMRSGTEAWATVERSTKTGNTFDCSYTIEKDGSVSKVRSASSSGNRPAAVLKESLFTARVGRCWLDSLHGREVSTHSSKEIGDIESQMSVSLHRVPSSARSETISDLMNHPPQPGEFTLEPSAAATRSSATEQMKLAILQEKHRAARYETSFGKLAAAIESGDKARSVDAMHELRDVLIAKPDFAKHVVENLKAGVSPELSAMLVHALETANTTESQSALASILKNSSDYSPDVLAQAIIAAGGLGTIKDPSIIEALDRIQSEFVGNQDEYPLGDAALFSLSRLAGHNPELRESLFAALKPMLAGNDDASRCTALLALTNTGASNPELIGLAENLLASPEANTRAAALAYFEALGNPSPSQIEAATQLLKDPVTSVQIQAIATLQAYCASAQNVESRAALKSIAADSSASTEVRDAARLALDTLSATARN